VLLTPPYSTLIWGVFPLHQIAHVGVSVSRCLNLFGCEIILEVFQPTVILCDHGMHRRRLSIMSTEQRVQVP